MCDIVAEWIASLPVSHAKRLASPENEKQQQATRIAGQTPFALLERSSQGGASWKTSQACLPGVTDTSGSFSESWPKRGMMLGGVCYRLPTLGLRTYENDSGLWPTPKASQRGDCPSERRRRSPSLESAVNTWPTPTVSGNNNRVGASAKSGNGLATTAGGPLNPTWVEWLMGWPLGSTDLERLETDGFRQWLRQHGKY